MRFFNLALRTLLLLLLAGGIVVVQTGCSGCRDDGAAAEKKKKEEEDAKKKKKKEKPKPDYEFRDTRTLPVELTGGTPRNAVKPGHWITVGSTVVANNFDFQGDLHSQTMTDEKQSIDIDHTNYFLSSSRPAPLPKGKPSFFETLFYVPRRFLSDDAALSTGKSNLTNLFTRITAAGSDREVVGRSDPPTMMEDYQFYIVVLSSNPTSYVYLRSQPTVTVSVNSLNDNANTLYYRVANPRIGNTAPVPSTALTWTSTAVVILDDIDPAKLTPEQQTAMIDWLHWGGQIIVSGPNSLDRFKSSFLTPYLPADSVETRKLLNDDLQPLNDAWSLKPKKEKASANWVLRVPDDRPLLGVKLQLNEGGSFIPGCGELVAERRVGGGRVVVTSFPLTDTRVVSQWWNFDNFFNSALLRRPARKYEREDPDGFTLKWKNYPAMNHDPRLVSTLRYFSRDIGRLLLTESERKEAEAALNDVPTDPDPGIPFAFPRSGSLSRAQQKAQRTYRVNPNDDDWHFGGYWSERESGVAGWNDFSGAAEAAKQTLKDAAKVKIPGADFVLKMVSIYLLVLVPANWLLFRLLGRVEWAWVAAPVIAIVAAGVVIRLAQLDIGFVRSRTDISIVELQTNYDRAHVTRYTALYTSLTTNYDLAFEDTNALSLPLAEDRSYKRKSQDQAVQVSFHRDQGATLRGFQVDSSSTAWTHSEQMLSCGGALSLDGDEAVGFTLKNATAFTLQEAGLLRRTQDGQLQAAWIEKLTPDGRVPIRFGPADDDYGVAEWRRSAVMGKPADKGDDSAGDNSLRLWRLVELAAKQLRLRPGEMRLIAWTDQELPGLKLRPTSAQFTNRSLIIAHLQRSGFPKPESDENTRADFDPNFGKSLSDADISGTPPEKEPAEAVPNAPQAGDSLQPNPDEPQLRDQP